MAVLPMAGSQWALNAKLSKISELHTQNLRILELIRNVNALQLGHPIPTSATFPRIFIKPLFKHLCDKEHTALDQLLESSSLYRADVYLPVSPTHLAHGCHLGQTSTV